MYNTFTTVTVNADVLEQPVDYQRLLLPPSSSTPFFQSASPIFPSSAQDYPELFYNSTETDYIRTDLSSTREQRLGILPPLKEIP